MSTPLGGPELAVGDRVALRVSSEDGVHSLGTRIEHVAADGQLYVEWPTEHLRLFPLRAGQSVVVEAFEVGHGLHTLEAVLESASMEEPPRLMLRPIAAWQQLQRRAALRYPLDMQPVTVWRLPGSAGDGPAASARVTDVSAGGVRLATGLEVNVGEQLSLAFSTPSGGAELRVRVTVLRALTRAAGAVEGWDVGCQFDVPSIECEPIAQFILANAASA